jgi:uncharacterized protein YdgA (DUF945 family)
MLKKIILAVVLLGLALGAAWAGTAWFAGDRLEQYVKADMEYLQHPAFKTVKHTHDRSLASSSGRIVLSVDPECMKMFDQPTQGATPETPAPDLHLVINYKATHGPRLAGWQAAHVESHLEIGGELGKRMQQVGIPAVLGSQVTQVRFDGSSSAEFDFPAWAAKFEDGSTVAWHGMSGSGTEVRGGLKAVKMEMSGKGLDLGKENLKWSMGPIKIKADLEYLNPRVAFGTVEGGVEHITMGEGPMAMQARGVRVYSDTKRNGDDLIDFEAGLQAKDGVVMGAEFRNFRSDLAGRRMHMQTLLALQDAMNGGGCSRPEPADLEKAHATGRKLAIQLLAHDPEFEIKTLGLENAQGKFEFAGVVRAKGIKEEDFAAPDVLKNKIDVEARGQMPVAIMQAVPMAEAWLMEGLLTLEATSVKTAMKYSNGVLSLNGKVVEPARLVADARGPQVPMEDETGSAFGPPPVPGPGGPPQR